MRKGVVQLTFDKYKIEKIKIILLGIITLTIIFPNIPKFVQANFIFGSLSSRLTVYFIPLLFFLVYLDHTVGALTNKKNLFFRYTFLYFSILSISLLVGLKNYPYYENILSGPVNQVDKLPFIYGQFSKWGVPVSEKDLLKIWMFARPIKTFLVEYLLTFVFSISIYECYKKNICQTIYRFNQAVVLSVLIVLLYSFLDLFYLGGNKFAEYLLRILNPIIHSVCDSGTWWPPLLWNNQLRSVFAEPSYFGIYMAFALPWIWKKIFEYGSRNFYAYFYWGMNFFSIYFLYLSRARTSNILLFGEIVLVSFFVMNYLSNKKNRLLGVILCSIVAIICSVSSINYFAKKSTNIKKNITVTDYLDDTVTSLANTDKRSNRSRYSIMIADFRIGLDHPILGVGIGLRNAYIPEYLPDKEHLSNETKMWIKNQKKKGIMKSGFPKLGEYTSRFAETGLIGVVLFLIPPIYLLWELFNSVRRKSKVEADSTQEIFFMISLMGILASGIGDSLNITYAYWIMLGLGYTILRKNREEQHESA